MNGHIGATKALTYPAARSQRGSGQVKREQAAAKVGLRFGRAVLTDWLGSNKHRRAVFRARCDCGASFVAESTYFTRARVASCGCFAQEVLSTTRLKHGRMRRNSPPDAAFLNFRRAEAEARRSRRLPAWYDAESVLMLYEVAEVLSRGGVLFHVDHIVPRTSRFVSGLHTQDNLQVVPARSNQAKGNRWWPDMPEGANRRPSHAR